jgi:2-C-methyl-D-erythritol 2,4-cyclodiphosphate synthase
MDYRIGIGYDIHRLVEGRALFMGGVEIPYIKGLLGHSDGDVLLHAICDGILGACSAGDIGELFPDTDPKYLNISSLKLLEQVNGVVKDKGFIISNIDTTIITQEPKIIPFKKQMIKKISDVLGIKEDCLNIKAKTNEGVDAIGQKEAIASYAAVILFKGGS